MKKSPIYLMMTLLSLSALPAEMSAKEKNPTAITANPKELTSEVKIMYSRLEEIKAMDKSSLTSIEKKNSVKKLEQ